MISRPRRTGGAHTFLVSCLSAGLALLLVGGYYYWDPLSAEREAAAQQREALETKISTLNESLEQARSKRDAVIAERDALIDERGRLAGERDAALGEVITLEARVQALRGELTAEDAELADLQAELSVARERLTTIEANLAAVTEERDAAVATVETQREQLTTLRSTATRLEGQVSTLQGEVREAQDAAARARQMLEMQDLPRPDRTNTSPAQSLPPVESVQAQEPQKPVEVQPIVDSLLSFTQQIGRRELVEHLDFDVVVDTPQRLELKDGPVAITATFDPYAGILTGSEVMFTAGGAALLAGDVAVQVSDYLGPPINDVDTTLETIPVGTQLAYQGQQMHATLVVVREDALQLRIRYEGFATAPIQIFEAPSPDQEGGVTINGESQDPM